MSVLTKVRIEGEGTVGEVPAEVAHLVGGPYYGRNIALLSGELRLLARAAGTPGIARFMMATDQECEIAERALGLTEPTTEEEYDAWEKKLETGCNTLGPWYSVAEGLAELDALLGALNGDSEVVRSIKAGVREVMREELLALRLILAAPGMASKRFRLNVN